MVIHPDRLTPFGKVAIFVGGCVLVAITTLDIHRSIRNNEQPPSKEQDASPQKVEVIGLISDTHGVLQPEAVQVLSTATGTIIHAGDIGEPRYKSRLKASVLIQDLETGTGSNVVAVTGNVDEKCSATQVLLPPFQSLTVAGKKILVVHICGFPPGIDPIAAGHIAAEKPDVVVFGHSHVPGVQLHNGTLYINPGSAGPSRFHLPQCVAKLEIDGHMVMVSFASLRSSRKSVMEVPLGLTCSYNTIAKQFEEAQHLIQSDSENC